MDNFNILILMANNMFQRQVNKFLDWPKRKDVIFMEKGSHIVFMVLSPWRACGSILLMLLLLSVLINLNKEEYSFQSSYKSK